MLLDVLTLVYDNPWYTALLIVCLAILLGEFHPVVVIKKIDIDPKTKKERKNDERSAENHD